MIRKAILSILVAANSWGGQLQAKGEPVFPLSSKKVYSVCEVRARGALSLRALGGRRITLRGEIGKSYHFGVILTDDHCEGELVRVILPVPDPEGVYLKFRFLETRNRTDNPESGDFFCDCSGRVKFQHGIPEMVVDDAVITSR